MRIFSSILILLFIGIQLPGQAELETISGQLGITGTISIRSTNVPIEGVAISSSNLSENYYTNAEGKFEIPFTDDEMWVTFSYPEYSSKEVLFHSSGEYNLVLSPVNVHSIDSKVSPYLGDNIKYKNGAYQYLTRNDVPVNANTTPGQMIQGHFAGVMARNISAMPGEGTNLNIRGISSLFGKSHPLVVVDGMPYNSNITSNTITAGNIHNPLKSIDVNDIQSIEVIKDGAALYGIRGSDGVILINTRQPQNVSTAVNLNYYSGVTFQPENIPLLNAAKHKAYIVNQYQNSGASFSDIIQENPWISGNPSYYYYYNYNNETDWQNEIFSPANTNKFNVELIGGDEIARFAVLLGYTNQEGIVENTGYQRYNFRLNSEIQVVKNISFISNMGFSYHISDLNNFSADPTFNPITSALTKSPMFGPYLRDNDGNRIAIFSDADEFGFSNPTVIVNDLLSSSFESNFLTNLKLKFEPSQNFKVLNTTHVSFNNIKDNSFIPDYGITDTNFGEIYNSAIQGVNKNNMLANETSFNIERILNEVHFLKIHGGYRITTSSFTNLSGKVYNTPTDEFRSLSSVSLVENTYIEGATHVINYSDLFLQNNYRYKDKYLLDLIMSFSASSNTGSEAKAISMLGGKWGFFPSIHGAWLLSSEPFLNSVDAIDLLKLRASFSMSGNDTYLQQSKYYYTARTYGLNSGIVRTFLPNETLKWESVQQINLGIDAIILREILSFGINLYNKTTSDLLIVKEIPAISGFQNMWENNGSLNTRGIELDAEFYPFNGDLKLSLGGNLLLSKSVVQVDEDILLDTPGGTVILRSGESPFSYFGLETNGIYGSQAEAEIDGFTSASGEKFQAGDVRFTDDDNNSIIDDKDRIVIGSVMPDISAGVNIRLNYRGIGLYILGDFMGGNQVFNYTRMQLEALSGMANQSIAAEYAWKNENQNSGIPRIAYADPSGNSSFSDRWIENGNIMRIREISLSYDLPSSSFYRHIRIFVSGQNLLTLSKYLGYYPEFTNSLNPAFQSTDIGQIPFTPSIIAGIKVGL